MKCPFVCPQSFCLILFLVIGNLQAATNNVSIGNNFFSPSAVTINVGDTVTWTMNGFNHNTESDLGQAEFWRSAILTSGQRFSHTFSTPGTYTYFCQPHRSSMRGTVTVRTPAVAPSITNQPQSITRVLGQSATFSVAASGTAPLQYQWLLNGTNLPGATSSSYTIASVRSSHEGSYRVTVSNAGGSTNSQSAILTVTIPFLSLMAFREQDRMVICWPTGFTNFVLESTPTLSSNRVWSPVVLSGGVSGTNFCHTNLINQTQQFFRLRAPN